MKAVYSETHDGPEALVVREVAEPGPPGPGQIEVAVAARGMSFTDVLMSRGGYQVQPPLPFVIGGEGAGEVAAVGSDVDGLAVGD